MGARKPSARIAILPTREPTGDQVLDVLKGGEPAPRVDTARVPRKKREPAPAASVQGRLITVPVRFTPEQRRAFVKEATRRMVERDAGRPDASEVLREFFDACYDGWLEGRR